MTLHGIQADLLGDAYAFRYVLDAVICTNRMTCELVRDIAEVPEQRVLYAPYGVEVPVNLIERTVLPKDGKPIRIAWVGRLEEEQKRVSDIPRILGALEARGQLFKLWIVGSGPEESVLREQLARWLERGQVRLLGELPRERVLGEIYPQADFMAALEEVYGADLDTLEQEWLDTLR